MKPNKKMLKVYASSFLLTMGIFWFFGSLPKEPEDIQRAFIFSSSAAVTLVAFLISLAFHNAVYRVFSLVYGIVLIIGMSAFVWWFGLIFVSIPALDLFVLAVITAFGATLLYKSLYR